MNNHNVEVIPLKDGQLHFWPAFISSAEADTLYQQLDESLDWRQDQIRMFGKWVKIPRLQAWYGDSDAHYQYSGLDLKPNPFTPALADIKQRIESTVAPWVNAPDNNITVQFNAVLANLYRQGKDSMGWHSDDEKELGQNPIIASLSLGETRRFLLKHRQDNHLRHEIALSHGSLLVMSGATQHHWLHSIPKQMPIQQPRINLTFRRILTV